jgi:hypothetical protein
MKKLLFIILSFLFFNSINAQTFWTEQTMFSGFVGRYEIRMTLAIPVGGGNQCFTIGEYYYTSDKGKISLCSSDDGRIVESYKGKKTRYFVLNGDWNKRIGQTISGTWYSLTKNKSYPVVLKVTGKRPD